MSPRTGNLQTHQMLFMIERPREACERSLQMHRVVNSR